MRVSYLILFSLFTSLPGWLTWNAGFGSARAADMVPPDIKVPKPPALPDIRPPDPPKGKPLDTEKPRRAPDVPDLQKGKNTLDSLPGGFLTFVIESDTSRERDMDLNKDDPLFTAFQEKADMAYRNLKENEKTIQEIGKEDPKAHALWQACVQRPFVTSVRIAESGSYRIVCQADMKDLILFLRSSDD